MTVGSLFAGIGGFELAAQWAGLTPVWSNEIDPFCCKVLRKNFKHRIIEDDIRNIGAHNLEPVDILTGGFPCQDISQANPNGLGLNGARSGLWFEMLRVISEVKPEFAVIENVTNLQRMGFVRVKTDLEGIGYRTDTFDISAASVGLPTMERHIWIVATANGVRPQGGIKNEIPQEQEKSRQFPRSDKRDLRGWELPSARVCGVGERLPYRMDRLKSLGNSIPPHVAYQILKAVKINSH